MGKLRSFVRELFLLLLTFSVGLLIIKYFEDKRNNQILAHADYVIGTIITSRDYVPGAGPTAPSRSAKLEYTYFYGGRKYKDSYTEHTPDGVEIGNRYFVIVNKSRPSHTIILLKRPIADSTDFKRYVEEFEKKKKQKAIKK